MLVSTQTAAVDQPCNICVSSDRPWSDPQQVLAQKATWVLPREDVGRFAQDT